MTVRRSAAIAEVRTSGINVLAAQPSLLDTLSARVLRGHYLDATAERYPVTVLGFEAARVLGIGALTDPTQVFLGERYVTVVGILAPVAVAPEIDMAALISFGAAEDLFGMERNASRIYLRADPDQVAAVASVVAATASPSRVEEVQVRRPSDLLVARIAAKGTFVGLFLGLGGIALLIAGVGIANIMVISVLERRGEIGLRRALGARRRHVAAQFLLESTLLGPRRARDRGRRPLGRQHADRPAARAGRGVRLRVAGRRDRRVYPAVRAARLSPTEALRTL